jgi:hypothetical protein
MELDPLRALTPRSRYTSCMSSALSLFHLCMFRSLRQRLNLRSSKFPRRYFISEENIQLCVRPPFRFGFTLVSGALLSMIASLTQSEPDPSIEQQVRARPEECRLCAPIPGQRTELAKRDDVDEGDIDCVVHVARKDNRLSAKASRWDF